MKVRREPEFSVFYPFGIGVLVNAFVLVQFASDVVTKVLVRIDRVLGISITSSVQKLEEIAENLRTVATVDFLDYQINGYVNVFVCFDIRVCKRLRDKSISDCVSVAFRFVRPDKCRIIRVWMEGSAEHLLPLGFRFYLIRFSASRVPEVDLLERWVGSNYR